MSIFNSLPFTLINGQTADATQVMSNFNQIVANGNTNAAANGANSDITSLAGLTTPLSLIQGGTGVGAFIANSLLLSGATSTAALTVVAAATAANLPLLSTASNPAFAPGGVILTLADATNGGVVPSASVGNVTLTFTPSDLLVKATMAVTDSFVIMDSAAASVAKTSSASKVFPQSATTNGNITLPGGIIVQWLRANIATAAMTTVSFPIAFPNACFAITTGLPNFSSAWNGVTPHLTNVGRLSFVADNTGNANTLNGMMFIAVGN